MNIAILAIVLGVGVGSWIVAPRLRGRTFYFRFSAEESHLVDASTGLESRLPPLVALLATGDGQAVQAIGAEARQRGDCRVVNPFAHERIVLQEFEAASALLRHQMILLYGRRRVHLRPRLVLHPKRRFTTVLTDVEIRCLVELALTTGATSIAVHTGPDLTRESLDTITYMRAEKSA